MQLTCYQSAVTTPKASHPSLLSWPRIAGSLRPTIVPCNFPILRSGRRCLVATKMAAAVAYRQSATYLPSLWGDDYVQQSSTEEERVIVRIEKLKEMVRCLIEREKEIVEQVELIDSLQQLGLAHHFEEEIKDVMSLVARSVDDLNKAEEQDLCSQALLFRILREYGFKISEDIFKGFIDETGSFKDCLIHDTRGLLRLYQASYLATEGDTMMKNARDFTTKHLRNLKRDSLDTGLTDHVAQELEIPLNWRMQRLHARWSIEMYEKEENMNPLLLELAKLDFNVIQSLYKRELKALSRWWADLDILGERLFFTKDRMVENFFWAVGWACEPKLWRCREAMTKSNCFVGIIDDIFDDYGSLEELELFTDAVERWEVSAAEQLPEYMKLCILGLYNTANGIAYQVLREKGLDIIPYLKRAWADLCKSFLLEAKWHNQGYTPTLHEYLDNAWISVSGHVALTHAYCVNEDVTVEALERFKNYPDMIRWSSMVFRAANDLIIGDIQKDVPNSIHCYMHETGVSEAVAREHVKDLITASWEKLNGDRFAASSFERSFISVALNIPRMAQCIYQNGDGYKKPSREDTNRLISTLIEPISL